jgi:hypothetical protein
MGSIGSAIEAVVARPWKRFKQLDHLKPASPKREPYGRPIP